MTRKPRHPQPIITRRPLFRVGPGLAIAIALSLVMLLTRGHLTAPIRRQATDRPIVERQVITTDHDKAGPVPEVSFLIERRARLGLTHAQLESLSKLRFDWEKLYYPKLKAANESAERAGEYLTRSERNKRTPTREIERQAAPVVDLSAEISAARRRYWAKAMGILTPKQQAIAERERKVDFAAKRKALADALRKESR